MIKHHDRLAQFVVPSFATFTRSRKPFKTFKPLKTIKPLPSSFPASRGRKVCPEPRRRKVGHLNDLNCLNGLNGYESSARSALIAGPALACALS